MRAAFLEAVQGIKDQTRLADLQAAIERGDFEAAIVVLGMDRAAFAPVEASLASSFATGGTATAAAIGRVPVPNVGSVAFRFDVRNPDAERWLTERSSALVKEINDDQLAGIRSALERGMIRGDNPRKTALDLVGRINPATGRRQGGIIGLTSQQMDWMSSARNELITLDGNYLTRKLRDQRFDSLFIKAKADKRDLTEDEITKIINQLENRTLKYRADTIARTEALDALRAGQEAAMNQAIELGEVEKQDTQKVWDATGDDRTRPDHLLMEGQTVGVDEPFVFPDGSRAMYPGDRSLNASKSNLIQCRCRLRYKIDFLGKQARIEGF